MDLVLSVGRGLSFRLEGVPDSLARCVRGFLAHYLRTPASDAPPIVVHHGTKPDPSTADAPVLFEEPPTVVRAAGAVIRFELPGVVAWCDPADEHGGIVLDGPTPEILTHFTSRVLPAMLFELAHHRGWMGLHAAAIGVRGRAILLPGPGSSGKSTIYVNAHAAGLDVLSDDIVWLHEDADAIRVVAFPRGAPLPPTPGPTVDDLPLGAVVCPSIATRDENRLTPISTQEALRTLISQCSFLALRELGGGRFRTLVRAARAVPCYRFEAGRRTEEVPGLLGGLRGLKVEG